MNLRYNQFRFGHINDILPVLTNLSASEFGAIAQATVLNLAGRVAALEKRIERLEIDRLLPEPTGQTITFDTLPPLPPTGTVEADAPRAARPRSAPGSAGAGPIQEGGEEADGHQI